MLQRDKTVIVIDAHGNVINKSNIRWKYVVNIFKKKIKHFAILSTWTKA